MMILSFLIVMFPLLMLDIPYVHRLHPHDFIRRAAPTVPVAPWSLGRLRGDGPIAGLLNDGIFIPVRSTGLFETETSKSCGLSCSTVVSYIFWIKISIDCGSPRSTRSIATGWPLSLCRTVGWAAATLKAGHNLPWLTWQNLGVSSPGICNQEEPVACSV